MVTDQQLDAWMATGIEARVYDPNAEHADYVVTLPEFNLEATGATLDDAIDAALAQFADFVETFVRQGHPLPERRSRSHADTDPVDMAQPALEEHSVPRHRKIKGGEIFQE